MKNTYSFTPVVSFFVIASFAGQLIAQDTPKDKEGDDHPLVSRYPGSVIQAHQQNAYDEYQLILGRVEQQEVEKAEDLEGKATMIAYNVPAGRSTLEVYRNYHEALSGAGFEMLWEARGEPELGKWGDLRRYFSGMHYNETNQRYLAARLKRSAEGNVYVALYLNNNKSVWVHLHLVEMKPMEQDMVKVHLSADEMLKEIEQDGRVAGDGIHFDSGKDEITAESKLAIDEIGKLLKDSLKMNLLVVGHTDSIGAYDYNPDLCGGVDMEIVDVTKL